MNRKTKILLWLIVFLSFAVSPIYGREYILFGNRSEGPAALNQSLNDIFRSSGIEISSMKKTFNNLGAVIVDLTENETQKFQTENPQIILVPADIKLYPSRLSSLKMSQPSTPPWHVILSRELQNYAIEQNADFDKVRVFILDSGIQSDHSDLYDKLQMQYALNFNGGASDDIADEYGHGTEVAGVVAGEYTGVCPYVKLIPLKVADNMGGLNTGNLSGVFDYIIGLSEDELLGKKIIINLSYNSKLFSSPNEETEATELFFDSVLSSLKTAGIVMVSSAGNDDSNSPPSGSNIDNLYVYPTKNESSNYISTAAVNRNGILMDFSHYGPTTVETGAPGFQIETATIGSTYATVHGTSFSSPFVAGVAAIIWALDPSLECWQIRNLAINAVMGVDINDNFIDEYSGSEGDYLSGSARIEGSSLSYSASLPVIAGQPISPSTVANNPDNPANPYGSFPVDNKSEVEKKIEEELDGCNVTSVMALPAVLLIPVLYLLRRGK